MMIFLRCCMVVLFYAGTLIPSDLLDKFYPRMNDRGDAVCVFACG